MEVFDKIYNCYYKVVEQILLRASHSPITRQQMEETARKYGYEESAFTILPKLLSGEWALLSQNESGLFEALLTPCEKLPLTNLQKSWIRALLEDRRIRLFLTEEELIQLREELSCVEPLFQEQDFHYYDRYLDGDNYASPDYQRHFHIIMEALENQVTLTVTYRGKQNTPSIHEVAPYQLQYSSKDDKFRLCCLDIKKGRASHKTILNLNRIEDCSVSGHAVPERSDALRFQPVQKTCGPVQLEISGERNSLERCMLHFANYEKHTVYDEERGVYLCSIYYDMADETELLIEILSFGPVVRVLGPEPFLAQVRSRVRKQRELLYGNQEDMASPKD